MSTDAALHTTPGDDDSGTPARLGSSVDGIEAVPPDRGSRDPASTTPIRRDTDAAAVATAAYEQLLDLLGRLGEQDWDRPTDCGAWDVEAMVGHVLGAARAMASIREQARQQLHGFRHRGQHDGNALDAANALQVADHAHLSPAEKVDELRRLVPAAVAGRMRMPGLVRRIRVPMDAGGSTAAGTPDTLQLGHLVDVVYTRDTWLHGIDIERATGQPVTRTAAVDGRIVEDVVAEWFTRHGQSAHLHLTGVAGGTWQQGSGDTRLDLDAIEFARILSGRADGDGLLAVRLVF